MSKRLQQCGGINYDVGNVLIHVESRKIVTVTKINLQVQSRVKEDEFGEPEIDFFMERIYEMDDGSLISDDAFVVPKNLLKELSEL